MRGRRYGTDGIMPGAQATPNQEAEIRHQVRRLGHHASLVAWSGCNECGGMGVYTDFVITTAVTEDKTRPVRSSCPWVGYSQGVDILTGWSCTRLVATLVCVHKCILPPFTHL